MSVGTATFEAAFFMMLSPQAFEDLQIIAPHRLS